MMGTGKYPQDVVDKAVSKLLWMGQFSPIAIEVTDMESKDVAQLIITWHRIGEHVSHDVYDLITWYRGASDMGEFFDGWGVKRVDYDELVASCL